MSGVLEHLMGDKGGSCAKSYFIGLERGRLWAEDCADYFEMRQWSELQASEFEDLILPHNEREHFTILRTETPIEWREYLRGWLEGVREIRQRY